MTLPEETTTGIPVKKSETILIVSDFFISRPSPAINNLTGKPKQLLLLFTHSQIFYFCGAAAGALLSPALPVAFSDAAALF